MDVEAGKKDLAELGLNLFAALDREHFPGDFVAAVERADVALEAYPSLVLIGHAGQRIWREVGPRVGRVPDPVDAFSIEQARRFVDDFLDGCPHKLLYPGTTDIPLQQLGAAAGWHHPSPLGLGINSVYGPWFGYRAVLLVGTDLPIMVDPVTDPPCQSCVDKPCVTACPASALSATSMPDVSACIDYRLTDHSPCAVTCLARVACPVGAEFRYQPAQLTYFYQRSLDSIRAYLQEDC